MMARLRSWARRHWRRLLPVILIGAAVTSVCFYAVRSLELEKRRIRFEHTADGYIALISIGFQTRLQGIGALHRFFESSVFVDIDEFQSFIEPYVAEDEAAEAIEWVPLVMDEDRADFELELSIVTSGGDEIFEAGPQGTRVRAPDRAFYFPIRYAEPRRRNETAMGFDLASDPPSLQALEKARDEAGPVVVPQVDFFQKSGQPCAFRILNPVYREAADTIESRRANLIGFVAGVYRCAGIVETALSNLPPFGLDLAISNTSDPDSPRLMYFHASRTRPDGGVLVAEDSRRNEMLSYRKSLAVADQTLEVVCTPAPAYAGGGIYWTSWLVLAGGLMLTGFLAMHLYFLQERNRQVSALVQKRTEELQESRTRLELAFAGADLGYWDWRVQTGEVIFSRRWAEMIGCYQEEIEPNVSTWEKAVHPDDREKVMKTLNLHLKGNTPKFEAEYRLRHRDGHDVWVLDRGRVIERDAAGEAIRACGTCLDITLRKQAHQARDLLAGAVEQIGDSLIITDQDGIIQYVNATFERITGYTREEVVGKFPHKLPGAGTGAHRFPEIVKTLQSGKTWQGMVDSRKKDGTLYYENAVVSPVFDENGKLIHHVAVRHDLTDRLRLEEEKERLELQYHQAQKLESIGRLAGGVAHDLNNLLGPILGYAEMLLQNTDKNDKRYDALTTIHKSGIRARDVVRQLLAFSRKQSLSMKEVDLSTVVEGFQDLLRRTLLENIQIEYKLVDGLSIKADVGQLEQALMNLAVNAQDAMPEGGLFVIETAETLLDAAYIENHSGIIIHPGRYAMLQVSDTGHGMDKATAEKIFEPFFSTKDMGKGTGLGLAMVYGTVKQHNGYIWVYSEPGKGTTFKVYFPLVEASPVSVSAEVPEAPVRDGVETVMVVEDDESIRKLTLQILSQKGYQVLTAANGAECLELLKTITTPIHILLTDVIMPDMNGKELYLQVEKRFPGMKVIYMSGYTDDVIAHHGVLSPGVHFIQKPFSVRDLAAKVREALDS